MQAIQDTKVDMTIWPAICAFLQLTIERKLIADVDSDEDAYDTQVAAVESALKTYGTSMVEGVSQTSSNLDHADE